MTTLRARCLVVLLADGTIEPYWLAESWHEDEDGHLELYEGEPDGPSFSAGEWLGVGELTLAEGVRLTSRHGDPVPPNIWEGFDEHAN